MRTQSASRAQESPHTEKDSSPSQQSIAQFPVVGVGASAGGLEAFTAFLKGLPADAGMAFG